MGFKEDMNRITEVIMSCWDCNQECDEDGNPLDGLTFDERLGQKISDMNDKDKSLMQMVLMGV